MDFILNFSQLDKSSLPWVGGKNASLGEMIKAGIRVPPGFAVTTDGYSVSLENAKIKDRIYHLLSDLDPDNIDALNQAAAEIQQLIHNAAIPDDVQQAIANGYSQLCDQCRVETVPVAIRSSATAEDLPTASFAGQQDTYLWITGADQVVLNVRKCWASLYTARAISYRIRMISPMKKCSSASGSKKW